MSSTCVLRILVYDHFWYYLSSRITHKELICKENGADQNPKGSHFDNNILSLFFVTWKWQREMAEAIFWMLHLSQLFEKSLTGFTTKNGIFFAINKFLLQYSWAQNASNWDCLPFRSTHSSNLRHFLLHKWVGPWRKVHFFAVPAIDLSLVYVSGKYWSTHSSILRRFLNKSTNELGLSPANGALCNSDWTKDDQF